MIVSQRINAKPMTNSELLIFLTFSLINATRASLLPELPKKLLYHLNITPILRFKIINDRKNGKPPLYYV